MVRSSHFAPCRILRDSLEDDYADRIHLKSAIALHDGLPGIERQFHPEFAVFSGLHVEALGFKLKPVHLADSLVVLDNRDLRHMLYPTPTRLLKQS